MSLLGMKAMAASGVIAPPHISSVVYWSVADFKAVNRFALAKIQKPVGYGILACNLQVSCTTKKSNCSACTILNKR